MRSLQQLCAWAVALVLPLSSLTAAQHHYLAPAPVSVIKPDPSEYHDYLPKLTGQAVFSQLNTSVKPWDPVKSPLPPTPFSQPSCGVSKPSAQSNFWLPNLRARLEGYSPFLQGAIEYKIYRDVTKYGAKGDGQTDDTAAFNAAITAGNRKSGGSGPGGTTGQPALIYVPAGTYIISSPIQMFIDTQLIGDAIDLPILKASSRFSGSYLVNGYDPGQGSTTNFYIGIRNVVLDTTSVSARSTFYALNWAVSQACSLFNVEFVMPQGSQHIGLEMDGGSSGGGSGTEMGNLTFSGGVVGLLFNNQQYALKNLKFSNVNTGIAITHGFIVSMQGIQCVSVGICVDAGGNGVTGSATIIDSSCSDCGVVINGTTTFLLENIASTNSGPLLRYNGNPEVQGSLAGKTYTTGHYYNQQRSTGYPLTTSGTSLPYTKRGPLTDSTGKYFTKEQPQYSDYPASAFSSVKDAGAKGDGSHDDTAAIQKALLANANCQITYFPYGVYVITSTLYVPPGTRIVGEVWSVITASGSFFANANNPQPMFQVGKPGDVGVCEISDMLFTVASVLPGAIIVEVNMAGQNQGDVSFHNSHFRIGGAADSQTETACQNDPPCKAAFMVLHLGKTSSTYIENMWLWSADHDLDGNYNQIVGTGRGLYVEATKSTWLIGIGSEHHTLYAMQLANAQNVYLSMLQVETPYWQPNPQAPSPWTPNSTWNDPTFSGGNSRVPQTYMQWSLRILGSQSHTLNMYGHGAWVFFNNKGSCTGPNGVCQISIVDFEGLSSGDGIELYGLNTRGVQNMLILGGSGGTPAVTTAQNPGSWGGVIAAYLADE